MNFSTESAVAEAARKHRERVEEFIRSHLIVAGFTFPVDVEVVKARCQLIQRAGMLHLCIDGKEVATMPDVVAL